VRKPPIVVKTMSPACVIERVVPFPPNPLDVGYSIDL
jgi:hypothetical protein